MNCCKCKCSFKNCIEERKEALNEEFEEMITDWMENHPEVTRIWINDKNCCLSNSISIHQNMKLDVKVYFE